MVDLGPFHTAAQRLAARFNRRFPRTVPKWDETSIKDRWYSRGARRIIAARMHLGGAAE